MVYETQIYEHACGHLIPRGAVLKTPRRKAKPQGTVSLFEAAKGRYIDEGRSKVEAETMAALFTGGARKE